MIEDVVYLLCGATSLACAILLGRAYRRSAVRLQLWMGLCFVGLFLNNVLLIIDVRVAVATDLLVVRQIPALVGIALLLFGLVWEMGDR
jgi:hypothetical protein